MDDSIHCDQKRRVDAAIAMLREHFDDIQILASVDDDGRTVEYFTGIGNFHARVNMAREFVIANDARVRQYAIED